ncbi:MAG: btr [Rhizobacter sp.]|nr:btr [Rhizobacter sp.]
MSTTPDIPVFADRQDPVAQTLHLLRMSGVVYCQSQLSAPWGLAMPPMAGCLMFHVFTSGGGWLRVDGEPARELRAGDFALVPHGVGHSLLSDPSVVGEPLFALGREPVADWFEVLRHGGGGEVSEVICGAVRFDDPVARHLAASLPALITIEGLHAAEMEWLHSSFKLLVAEATQQRPGGETVITRLADILVIQAIRSWLESDAARQTGWLRGLQDRHVGRALARIHRDLAQPWTLAGLAREAGLSRSAFAARFTHCVGTPPMEYLTQWRMRVAQARLKERKLGLAQLAGDVGYDSEAAFSRAFKRVTGITPGSVQRDGGGR